MNLQKDLAEAVRLQDSCKDDIVRLQYDGTHDACTYLLGCVELIRTHHAEIAQNAEAAKLLAALEQAMDECASKSGPCNYIDEDWIALLRQRADEIMLGGE